MNNRWAFGRKMALGYLVMAIIALGVSLVGIFALRAAIASKDQVIDVDARLLVLSQHLDAAAERRISAMRGYLVAHENHFLAERDAARAEFDNVLAQVTSLASGTSAQADVDSLRRSSAAYRQASDQASALMQQNAPQAQILRFFDAQLAQARNRLSADTIALTAHEEAALAQEKAASNETAVRTTTIMSVAAALAILFAIIVAFALSRTLGRQISAAVGHVQSSSTELQAAASQQASGSKEQATAMNEISTTISELVATSRQIAESAQRVAEIAEQTAGAAKTGETIVENGQTAIAGIRQQVDLIVAHMLDLGRKSQEIGVVLDVVSELAEQTNILAINATIEATGAGDAGKRFAVVADEIRKLADRVANSTKSIRVQIEEVRGAVNTTVLATEGGAKAVDSGTRQFQEVAVAFKQIAGLVEATTDAGREIELSTKQQATAAEQVRVAVADVAQATQETQASSSQTLQTASQLAGLSLELRRLILPDPV